MRQITGNLFDYPADAICITTNGIANSAGLAVMGRGTAKQAADQYSWLRKALAERLKRHGNHVYVFDPASYSPDQLLPFVEGEAYEPPPLLVTLPVKHHWKDRADPQLIMQSMRELICIANALDWEEVALCRPGCGNGGLSWDVVEGLLCTRLDDRFVIVERENG